LILFAPPAAGYRGGSVPLAIGGVLPYQLRPCKLRLGRGFYSGLALLSRNFAPSPFL
jgi:hypothetical protein